MGLSLTTDGQGQGGDSENQRSQMLQGRGAHQLPTRGKMSLLGPGLGLDSGE